MTATGQDRRRDRSGMSLVELVVALTVFGVVISASLGFLAGQNRAFRAGMDRMDALQTGRFALSILEKDLRTAGIHLAPGQPGLAFAGPEAVAFYADYATNASNDPFAVYHEPGAPTGQVIAPLPTLTIPRSGGATHPDTTYRTGSVRSFAELLVFFFEPDTSTARPDDWALFRKVNRAPPEVVARNLLAPSSGAPFFAYLLESDGPLEPVPDTLGALDHAVPVHLSAADTGRFALIDSVRAVRVSLRASNGREGEHERVLDLSRLIHLPNLGFGTIEACGAPPILGTTLDAAYAPLATGEPAIVLTWAPAADEVGGETDVVAYVIWRREVPATSWDAPYLSIPAGATSYLYHDSGVESGRVYEYALAAQDCTPSLSGLVPAAGPVPVP